MKRIKKRQIKTKNIARIFLLIFIIIFIFSLTKIIFWYQENTKGKTILKSLKKDIQINNNLNEAKYKIDFKSLKEKNSDTVAFIKIKGTSIEYPVVKSSDNDYYLTHSFDKSNNSAGWVFANYLNKFDGSDKNITLFAHARYDGSMFGTLYKTLSSNWQNSKENQNIIFITEKEESTYQVFSTYKILQEDYYIKVDFKDDEEFQTFIKTIQSRSNHDYQTEVSSNDTILTLSTCANDENYRIVIHAKKNHQ